MNLVYILLAIYFVVQHINEAQAKGKKQVNMVTLFFIIVISLFLPILALILGIGSEVDKLHNS